MNYPSMSYCKFENTLAHLKQIEEDLLNPECELSRYEAKAKKRIIEKILEWACELEGIEN